MKIIELIKEKLGLDDKDLNKDLDLKAVKKMQTHLDDIADDLIAEQTRLDMEAQSQESQAFKERLQTARAKQHKANKTRAKLRHMKNINPARLRRLQQEGKI
ncbi:MAG: hypothetical protein O3A43_01990 [Proteobacteria bacterium]|nr:hypothetical protein [Pseudomonadota bacterium]MDA1037699.1 hypothetical protein [Pseudomonadota bacterium]